MVDQDKIVAAAIRRKQALQLDKCIDPTDLNSRPYEKQLEILQGIKDIPIRAVISGNRCLVKNTLVLTPTGPIAIQDIKPGDSVYSEQGNSIKVLEIYDNGIKEVADITVRNVVLASCTAEHVWEVNQYSRQDGSLLSTKQIQSKDFEEEMGIKRVNVNLSLGNIDEPHAYAIGALLGDGCSRQKVKEIQISSGISEVPIKVATILNGTAYRKHPANYTWGLSIDKCNLYNEWCKGRYAHEKIVDMRIIKSWNRQSLLNFVAGIIDTDGTLYANRGTLFLGVGMQALSVIEAIKYAFLALWQIPLNYTLDDRSKYKNGPIHCVYTRNTHFIKQVMQELNNLIVSPQKKWRDEYATLGGKRSRVDSYTARWGKNHRLEQTYDIKVDSPTNLYLLANGMVTHNSGKSSLAGRELAWLLEDKHPYLKRAELWGEHPITVLVLGQVGEQMESNLWNMKIRPFLSPSEYKEVRIGNALQRVEMKNKDRIIFISHHNCNEARKSAQGYDAHYVWIDEMPTALSLVIELVTRILAKHGRFLLTFTPLLRNLEIKQYIESLTPPVGKLYNLHMLDNPVFFGREQEVLDQFENYPESERRARLYGEWFIGSNAVYQYNPETQKVPIPQNYSRQWKHVEAVDPAATNKVGYVLYAQNPESLVWYIVKAKYMDGAAPSELVAKIAIESAGYNIVRRISDPHETWFIKEAYLKGLYYEGVYNKTNRKMELIKNLQEALTRGSVLVCDTCETFFEEVIACQWNDSEEGIKNGSKYHVLDSCQYGLDVLPLVKATTVRKVTDPLLAQQIRLREQHTRRKQLEQKIKIKRGTRWGRLSRSSLCVI